MNTRRDPTSEMVRYPETKIPGTLELWKVPETMGARFSTLCSSKSQQVATSPLVFEGVFEECIFQCVFQKSVFQTTTLSKECLTRMPSKNV